MAAKYLSCWTDVRMMRKWRKKNLMTSREWKELGTCAAVILFFNPFGSFQSPFPTFSVLIDKHREGKRPRDESFWLLLPCMCVCVWVCVWACVCLWEGGWASLLWFAAVSWQTRILIWFQLLPWLSICLHYDVTNKYKKVVLNICLKVSHHVWYVLLHLQNVK